VIYESIPRDGTWEFPARVKIRICTGCNSLMGRVYEETTAGILKPMIAGEVVPHLSPHAQAIIGRWCIKTIILMHMKHAMTLGKHHRGDADSLLRMNLGGLPPDATSVRVARYIPEAPGSPAGRPLRGSLEGARKLVSTSHSAIGHLAIEVLSGTPPAILDFIDRTKEDDRFVRVWPPRFQNVAFAPREFVTQNDLDEMSRQLAVVNETSHHYERGGTPRRRSPVE
jgi:hypothetical protein